MNQNVKYSGFSAVPSDYECADGSLAVSVNLLPEDGALRPVLPPSETMQLEEGETILYIHKVSASVEHYITVKYISGQTAYWLFYYDKKTKLRHEIGDNVKSPLSVSSIGNTLIVLYDDKTFYYLWNNDAYKPLGSHLPEIHLSFGLQGHPRFYSVLDPNKACFTITFNDMAWEYVTSEFPDTQKTQITEQIMAKVNKFLADQSVNKGRFALPFFVRYGLRLFDGSLVMHSAPVLMNPCTTNNPIVVWRSLISEDNETVNTAVCDMMIVACDLDFGYNFLTSDSFGLWTDIVKSVDIFISKPLYPYDQSGKITSCIDADDFNSVFIGKLVADGDNGTSGIPEDGKLFAPVTGADTLDTAYSQWLFSEIYALYFSSNRAVPGVVFHMPEFTDAKNSENIRNCSNFYLLHSIELSELTELEKQGRADNNKIVRNVIPIEDDYLQSLVTREAMTDDYLTHDRIIPKYTFGYNSRMNYANIRRELFKGFPMSSMVAFCNCRTNVTHSGTTMQLSRATTDIGLALTDRYAVQVTVKENGEEHIVRCNGNYDLMLSNFLTDEGGSLDIGESWGCYFFYPNANAQKLTILPLGLNSQKQFQTSFEIPLKQHDFLNGAYALLDYNTKRVSSAQYSGDRDDYTEIIDVPNKIYTSEVNNPFYFPLLGINTVGTGEIRGICSAAKALSQGQFGQFPLYAFTTEGVWALEVSSSGTYSARQPITRDVCVNTEGITQLDSEVLFPTDRGIMLISGSQTRCISDDVNSDYPFDATQLPGFTKLHAMLGHEPSADSCLPTLPFSEFLQQCRMVYDYVHQRVIVYAPSVTYAYIYSLKTQQWGMMFSHLVSHLNSYPEALAVDSDNKVLNFSVPQPSDVKCLYATRPLKFGVPDVLKTVDCIIQSGLFRKSHVATVLYGSRDLFHWHLVWSSKDQYLRGFRGSPYKYFRIAGVATLSADETVYGASVQFTPRQTDKPR